MDRIDICSVEKLTMQVLSTRYFFLQRMITEHNSVLLVGGMSRSNFVEEIKFLLYPPFAIFIDLSVRGFSSVVSLLLN